MTDIKNVYFDYSATTFVKPEVFEEMIPYFSSKFGNPSSVYSLGRESKKAIEESRNSIAEVLNAESKEIYFTGSGSEANNWAIKGIAYSNRKKGNHIITSSIEHHAVLETCEYLEKQGFVVTYVPVEENGIIDEEKILKAIRPETILVSVMYANNEIGTIQPIEKIAKITKEKGIYFHTDAVQAVGSLSVDVKKLGIDLLSISAHKFYGPKGVGVLFIKKGTKIDKYIHGGAQERQRRASTENVPGIVGMGKAILLAVENMDNKVIRLEKLRNKLIKEVMAKIPYTRLNGDRNLRLPGNVNFSFEFIEGESLLLMLDMKGIAASSGSACTSGSLDPSHVLLSIGLPHEIAHGSLRISLGDLNTEEDINYLMEVLPEIVEKLREMSPLYENVRKA
ncbi:MAG: cysteine desulfurase NifS [Clostridiales bacterium]